MLFLVFILFLSFLNCSIFPFFSICQLLHVIPLKLSHGSCMFYSIFFILFSFHVGTFLLICIPVNWFFLHCVQSMDGTIKGLILSVTVIFISSTSFDSYITHLFLHVATFSTRALNSLIIILNSLSIIPTSMSYVSLVLMIAFSFQSVFFFLAFGMPCDFLLKVRHAVPAGKNWGKQNFIVWIYANLNKRCAVFNFASKYKYQRLPNSLVTLLLSSLLTLACLYIPAWRGSVLCSIFSCNLLLL